MRRRVLGSILPVAVTLASAALARDVVDLPARFKTGRFAMLSLSGGYPNDGWQLRGKRLRPSPELHIREASRERVYGHPALVLMLGRSARDVAKAAPHSVLLVGDLSAKLGGPLSGHRSHQSGRDADVAFYVTDLQGKPVPSTQYVAFDGDGKAKDGRPLLFDDERNWLLVESWARDRRAGLSHIFVSWPLRDRLLKFARSRPKFAPYVLQATALLKQPEKGEAHDDHFHVRITCPKEEEEICRAESKIAVEGAGTARDASPSSADAGGAGR
ncbi:MAG TPA: penicillin-insensitive murein endopeptidase [Polyangiaceae bacterium]|nr:penicillin-insensitive murein endopeptidase [Polyangiaceae bacterium]